MKKLLLFVGIVLSMMPLRAVADDALLQQDLFSNYSGWVNLTAGYVRDTTDADPIKSEDWVGTGGTFTTLAAMVLGQPWTDRTHVHGATIAAREIREIGETLAGMKVEDRIHLQGLQPSRADIVVHGICILLGVMGRLGMDRITVSEWGNLDGYFRKYFCNS